MARFLLATIPLVGHVAPMIRVAQSLVNAGHDVRWYTGKRFQARVEATGAHFVPMEKGFDYSLDENVPLELGNQREALKGLAQLKFDLKIFFIKAAIAYAQDLLSILQRFPADVMLADSFFIAIAWVHEAGGPPWAQLGISVLSLPSKDVAPFGLGLPPRHSILGRWRNQALYSLLKHVAFRDVLTCVNQARAELSLPPTDKILFDLISPYLYLANTVPRFEYPRNDLLPQVHFTGPSIPQADPVFTEPAWWNDLNQGKPVVHVTQGTVASNSQDLILPTIQAMATEDVLLVVTTGNKPVESLGLPSLPDNVRVEQFIPHPYLLPHVDVMVTNGGYNGVQMALAQGIPLVAGGKSEDKPEVCARVAWSGVGVNLKTKSPRPSQIRQAVQEVLTNPRYRQNAERIQADIQRYQAQSNMLHLLEQLANTQRPVLRKDATS